MRNRLLIFCAILLLPFCTGSAHAEDIHRIAQDRSKAVFFVYFHIGEDQYPGANIQMERFREHVLEMKTAGYNVLPLGEIVSALENGTPLPQHTIGITLEGAYRSSFENAVPLLLEAGLPFTIFLAPERIDRDSDFYMNWREVKKLARNNLVTIGAMAYSYDHLIRMEENAQRQQLTRAIARFQEELGATPEFFAWPHGEYTAALQETLPELGFRAGFGQQSGVAAHGSSDMTSLPRFSMTDQYGGLDRFRLTAQSFPFPVLQEDPPGMIWEDGQNSISFTLPQELRDAAERLACFVSDTGKVPLTRADNGRITLQLEDMVAASRIRMNCTLPVLTVEETKHRQQIWRWYGRLFTGKDGSEAGDDDETLISLSPENGASNE